MPEHDQQRCALLSLADEPLAGSSPEAPRWLLVEDPGPWGRDGLLDGALPPSARDHVAAGVAAHGVRYQAIRRGDRRVGVQRTVMLVNLAEGWAARTRMADDDLAGLDLAVAAAPHSPTGWEPVVDPIVAVCTHAKRDACCALWGRPIAATLEAAMPGQVWETSHTGGHRFAASLLTFPDGGVHGRVTDALGFAATVAAGRIPLATYRGNAALPRPAQAAEVAVRARHGLAAPSDVVISSCRVDGTSALVVVRSPSGSHEAVVEQASLPPRPTSCGGEPKDPHPWVVATIDGVPAGDPPGLNQVVDSHDANNPA